MRKMDSSRIKIGILSLGCARNLVDAEVILGYLKKAGFSVSFEIEEADVAIVNTCCFIREAEEESVDTILSLSQLKAEGKIKKIVVCGCLAQRYKKDLINELKEVDAFLGVGDIDNIAGVIKEILNNRKNFGIFNKPQYLYSHSSPRVFLTPEHFTYIKISEGCSHHCSFCVIPCLRGKYRSRPIDSILKEAEAISNQRRVCEINLIGQDTTIYGKDLYGKSRIGYLLEKLSKKAKGRWIRLLYAHPANFPQELIGAIRDIPAICKYIDLPIQHINDRILKKMKRETTPKDIFSLIEKLRKEIPALAIRTTLIVGFPGETDSQFRELLDFIRQMKFERLGIFKYSKERGTCAFDFSRQIPENVKQSRYDQALSLQRDLSEKINQRFLGKQLQVLIDEKDTQNKNQFLGRTQYDAPEVDGCVYVKSKKDLRPGDFVQVKIADTLEYDLAGEVQ